MPEAAKAIVEENLEGRSICFSAAFVVFLYFEFDKMNALSDEGIRVYESSLSCIFVPIGRPKN